IWVSLTPPRHGCISRFVVPVRRSIRSPTCLRDKLGIWTKKSGFWPLFLCVVFEAAQRNDSVNADCAASLEAMPVGRSRHTEFSRAAELLLPRSVCFYPLCRMLIVKSAIRHRLQQCNCAILLGRTLI